MRIRGRMLVVLVGTLATTGVFAEERYALVIGNSAYEHVGRLKNPANDVELIAARLKAVQFNVTVIRDAKIDQMDAAIDNFITTLNKRGEDAVGVFYFAGHGVEVDGRNYLLPVGFHPDKSIRRYAINANNLLEGMDRAKNAIDIMILDACRNNPFPESSSRSMSRGLAKMEAATGSLIVYSTSPGNVADDGRGEYSPFAEAFAEELIQGADHVASMIAKVTSRVSRETGGRQRPWLASSLTGPFSFTPRSTTGVQEQRVEPRPSPAPTGLGPDERYWAEIKDSKNPEVFELFAKQFPTSNYAALALIRKKELDKPAPVTEQRLSNPVVMDDADDPKPGDFWRGADNVLEALGYEGEAETWREEAEIESWYDDAGVQWRIESSDVYFLGYGSSPFLGGDVVLQGQSDGQNVSFTIVNANTQQPIGQGQGYFNDPTHVSVQMFWANGTPLGQTKFHLNHYPQ